MKLTLQRHTFLPNTTIGNLSVDGRYFCKTLEGVDCNGTERRYGETAVPRGTYNVIIDWCNEFRRELPHVLDVPGFVDVRIYPGNKASSSEGRILVGERVNDAGFISNSQAAFDRLIKALDDVYEHDEAITLEVK